MMIRQKPPSLGADYPIAEVTNQAKTNRFFVDRSITVQSFRYRLPIGAIDNASMGIC